MLTRFMGCSNQCVALGRYKHNQDRAFGHHAKSATLNTQTCISSDGDYKSPSAIASGDYFVFLFC
jgi:hypothetical protein